ncbi:MAG: MFS transporter [Candidatus Bathyarchaeota archaeon]|nr:MFS transporter [Candidatus Bathyarchaeota archaeon]
MVNSSVKSEKTMVVGRWKAKKPFKIDRLVIFVILSTTYLFAVFHRFSPAVISLEIMREFNMSAVALGVLSSAYFYSYAILQIPVGLLADSVGPRKTVSIFTLIASLGTLVFAAAKTFELVVLGRLLTGVGVSVVWVCTIKIISRWFKKEEFATFNGMFNTIGNIGAISAAAPLAFLTLYLGWRSSFLLIAGITFFLALMVWFFVRDEPAQIGLPSTVKAEKEKHLFSSVNEVNLAQGLKLVFSSKNLWVVGFTLLVWYGTLVNFQGLWSIPYLIQVYGFDRSNASNLITLIPIGVCVGAPLWGYISDKVLKTRKTIYVLGYLSYTLTWIVFIFLKNIPKEAFYPVFFMLGFFSGAIIVSIALLREFFPEHLVGTDIGCKKILPFIGVGILQPLTGYILDQAGPVKIVEDVKFYPPQVYQTAFTVCIFLLVTATLTTLISKEEKKT